MGTVPELATVLGLSLLYNDEVEVSSLGMYGLSDSLVEHTDGTCETSSCTDNLIDCLRL